MLSQTIPFPAADGDAETYVTRPHTATSTDESWPGVLFLVDAIGLREQTRRMADRIASWGYVVAVPHVFYRDGAAADLPAYDLLLPEDRAAYFAEAMPRVRALTPEVVTPDLTAYIAALKSLPGVAENRIGITGYCMGGRLALLAAAAAPLAVGAVGLFHTGRLVTEDSESPHLHLSGIDAFVLAIHADKDAPCPRPRSPSSSMR